MTQEDKKAAAAPPDPDDIDVIDEPEVSDPPADPEPPASDPIVQLAVKLGFNPDYKGPGAVDAETFILRSREINDNLSKRVRSMNKEITALREGVETVRWTAEQQSKREIGKLKAELADLKAQRRRAITDGDADMVDQLDDRIDAIKESTREAPKPPTQPSQTVNPEYEDWVEKNAWYIDDSEMREYADRLLQIPEIKALPYTRLLNKVETSVKSEFPDKFKPASPPPKPDPAVPPAPANPSSAVAPVSPSRQRAKPSAKPKATADDLSYHERKVGEEFVALGQFKNLDEYAQSLAEYEHATKNKGGGQ